MKREYIAEWFSFADMDLATAEHLISKTRKSILICIYNR